MFYLSKDVTLCTFSTHSSVLECLLIKLQQLCYNATSLFFSFFLGGIRQKNVNHRCQVNVNAEALKTSHRDYALTLETPSKKRS